MTLVTTTTTKMVVGLRLPWISETCCDFDSVRMVRSYLCCQCITGKLNDVDSGNFQRLPTTGRSSADLASSPGWKGMTVPRARIDFVVIVTDSTCLWKRHFQVSFPILSFVLHMYVFDYVNVTFVFLGEKDFFKMKCSKDSNFSISQMNRSFACL